MLSQRVATSTAVEMGGAEHTRVVCLFICLFVCFQNIQFRPFLNPLPTYTYIHVKTTFMYPRSTAGVSSSQALPGFLITAPPSVCVPDVIGALACGFQTKDKNKNGC
mmetsp:Transcript_67414/g.109302  ORF Transcript_67414/g.109302 Transcript_67414/m.109302 type:complete len:107 (-) Transcript_67414:1235-1555(-)